MLAAELGVTVFRLAFARWVGAEADRDLAAAQDGVLAEVRALAGT